MWFKNQYGKTPADCGMKAAVPRVKRLFIFFRWRQVVFAPDRETADAFDKGQKIMETAFSGMLVLPLFALLGLMALLTQSVLLCGVVILLCLAALVAKNFIGTELSSIRPESLIVCQKMTGTRRNNRRVLSLSEI